MGRRKIERIYKARVLNDSGKTIQAMSTAINRRDFAEAIEIGEGHIQFGPAVPRTAHFWFQLSLTHRLVGNESDADQCWMEAKGCRDYTLAMEGDFLCDVALAYIRDGRTVDAKQLFQRIRTCYSGDLNRVAKLDFVLGRYKAARADYLGAVSLYQQAEKRWLAIGKRANLQWLLNCRVHMIRAYALGGMRYAVKDIYRRVKASTPKPNHRQLAAMLAARYGGRLGVRLVDRFA